MTQHQNEKPRGGCINYKWRKNHKGYGQISINGKTIGVHRISWALQNGRMPNVSMDICHSCDNPSCINPEHLFEGTRKENM